MKWYKLTLVFACTLGFTGTSCKKNLLEVSPSATYTEENFFKTANDAILAVNGIYAYTLSDNFAREIVNENVLTDDLAPQMEGTTDHLWGLSNGLETPSGRNHYPYRFWSSHYVIIVRANVFLARVDAIQMDPTLKKRLIAEAKFLRAFCYHRLVWRFGDVPLLTKDPNEEPALPERAPKADVVKQIYADLTSSYADLPVKYTGADIGRVTRGGALLLLAKEYLYNKDWANAAKFSGEAMTLGYTLLPNMSDLFKPGNKNTAESLFEFQAGDAKGGGYTNLATRYPNNASAAQQVPGGGASYGNISVLQSLVNEFERLDGSRFDPTGIDVTTNNTQYQNRDPRLGISVVFHGAPYGTATWNRAWTPSGYTFRKYTSTRTEQTALNGTGLNWIMYRYADVLLVYAEAQNEAVGPDVSVFAAINQVRARVGMPPLQNTDPSKPTYVADKNAMRDRIMHERRVEFAGESSRYEDLVRWGLLKSALENKHLSVGANNYRITNWQEFRYLWPVPQLEIDNNPNLKQNPGY
ncbi:RagB/SusD family nutrient uptake outer membrane protein [Segetibacter sp. 3557_3]|uniref:RagB/SusD family nutrient uptake outer membrane protein n=1 Tax=Segetibacter sp. 3557_3 TaxID=2547429 RepID=UPI001058A0F2|nr:RagB/SusD family nutrient uptake outer membrane protein [Segetibacter sp. 3557_3]TDH20065.1 RagB/SusD family nutrient uptake outer membrane protein [Segetibacter sp. 3557_3]